jgi:hypothetical protein
MFPTFDYYSGVKPLASQPGEEYQPSMGIPQNPSKPLEITLGNYMHSLILFQACVKMKPIMSLVFILSRARNYMRM